MSPTAENLADLSLYQKRRRMVGAGLILALLTVFMVTQPVFVQETVLHEIISLFGVLLIVVGIVGRLWCTIYIGGRKAQTFVDTGPYSVCRNPLYFFSSIAAAGVGAQTGSLIASALFFALCNVAFYIVVRREERYLAANFGPEYRDYLKRVPRFFPDFALFTEGPAIEFKSKRLLNTLLDGLLFFAAIPIFECIAGAQGDGYIPVLFRLP